MPRRNGPAPRSFAAEAHGCFMVRIRGVDSTECKVAARSFAPDGGHPSVRSRSAHAPRPGLASGRRRLTIAGRSTTATGQTPAILARQKDDGHRQKRLEKNSHAKLRTCGTICAAIFSATASGTATRRSSTLVAMPGTPSWSNPRSSPQLEPEIGHRSKLSVRPKRC